MDAYTVGVATAFLVGGMTAVVCLTVWLLWSIRARRIKEDS